MLVGILVLGLVGAVLVSGRTAATGKKGSGSGEKQEKRSFFHGWFILSEFVEIYGF